MYDFCPVRLLIRTTVERARSVHVELIVFFFLPPYNFRFDFLFPPPTNLAPVSAEPARRSGEM